MEKENSWYLEVYIKELDIFSDRRERSIWKNIKSYQVAMFIT